MGILTDKTCSWFQKSVQLQIIAATITQNAREIREIVEFFPHCALDVFQVLQPIGQGPPQHNLNAKKENVVDFPHKHNCNHLG